MSEESLKSLDDLEGYQVVDPKDSNGSDVERLCMIEGQSWVFLPVKPIRGGSSHGSQE